jgi:hypothetical protein
MNTLPLANGWHYQPPQRTFTTKRASVPCAQKEGQDLRLPFNSSNHFR